MKSSAEELAANRGGRLTEGQREILEQRIRSTRWFYLGFCALFLVLAALFTIGIYSETGGDEEILPVIIGMDVVIVLLTLPHSGGWEKKSTSCATIWPRDASGRTAGRSRWAIKVRRCWWGISGFRCQDRRGMSRGARLYTVYYVPRTGVIVGIEKS